MLAQTDSERFKALSSELIEVLCSTLFNLKSVTAVVGLLTDVHTNYSTHTMTSWLTGWSLSGLLPTTADIDITFHKQASSTTTPTSSNGVRPSLSQDDSTPSTTVQPVSSPVTTITGTQQNAHPTTPPVYSVGEIVNGNITIGLRPGSKIQHDGIRVECIGEIIYSDNRPPYIFYSSLRELVSPDILLVTRTYPYEFKNIDMEYDTYGGVNVQLRYYIRVTVLRSVRSGGNLIKQREFLVVNISPIPIQQQQSSQGIRMEVGIEDCLHLEFEYNHSYYHLQDVVIGRIYFLLVRIKLKYMELVIIRREQTQASGVGQVAVTESTNIAKFEVMDGSPVKGESIPIRLFLTPYDLTPTHPNVHNKFNVKYYLNLVLVDDDDRRYFKQHEIILWRKTIDQKTPMSGIK